MEVQDGDKKGSLHKGFYWVYHSPEQRLLVMEYRKTRARAGPVGFLHGYEGLLQTDGYVAYDIFDADPSVTLYACMAHARRKFFDCKTYEPDKAAHVLKEIRKLYLIERWLRKTGASADVRQQLRQERAGPVLEELKPWLEVNNGLPKSPWAKATQYTLGRWQRLTRYLDEGRVELDNTLVENAIRPLAIGRKNYMFAGSHDASQRGCRGLFAPWNLQIPRHQPNGMAHGSIPAHPDTSCRGHSSAIAPSLETGTASPLG